jgi:hypothetical protein
MRWQLRLLLALGTAAVFTYACVGDEPGSSSPLPDGGDAARPGDASLQGSACTTPGQLRCSDDDERLLRCLDNSTIADVPCPFGCQPTDGGGRCGTIAPVGAASAIDFEEGKADLAVAAGVAMTIDSDTGEIKRGSEIVRAPGDNEAAGIVFRRIPQPGAGHPEIGTFVLKSITSEATGEIKILGVRPIALLLSEKATLGGDLVVRGTCDNLSPPIAGGYFGGMRDRPPIDGSGPQGGPGVRGTSQGGAGGAGGRHTGAPGGFIPGGATDGGTTAPPIFVDFALLGGSGGGGVTFNNAIGGTGGGAIQIVAKGAILLNGAIDAGGCGGGSAAGGGGAGGSIVLEGTEVTLGSTAVIVANGGGGGGESKGENGRRDRTPAAGGGAGLHRRSGGNGGVGELPPTNGQEDVQMPSYESGGGGGAAGRVGLRTRRGTANVAAEAIVSPPADQATVDVR